MIDVLLQDDEVRTDEPCTRTKSSVAPPPFRLRALRPVRRPCQTSRDRPNNTVTTRREAETGRRGGGGVGGVGAVGNSARAHRARTQRTRAHRTPAALQIRDIRF
ncbi:hypothetical protein EVAR_88697_1 [Eumeta japonica]|uniref:Uncharacterized protein n=1 Tax=Eumeta variegata TaxID=151549 RepID=A0A4C1Y270_EUMVA|nr:hypothetical protein EVAR_88697_1 [Eumeta japonica]